MTEMSVAKAWEYAISGWHGANRRFQEIHRTVRCCIAICCCKCRSFVNFPEVVLAKTSDCFPIMIATILQPNLSPPVRLRQRSEGKARLFLSEDDKNEHLFGFRGQKVAGSNPVTSTTKVGRFAIAYQLFLVQ